MLKISYGPKYGLISSDAIYTGIFNSSVVVPIWESLTPTTLLVYNQTSGVRPTTHTHTHIHTHIYIQRQIYADKFNFKFDDGEQTDTDRQTRQIN